jgi:hypothetical protein
MSDRRKNEAFSGDDTLLPAVADATNRGAPCRTGVWPRRPLFQFGTMTLHPTPDRHVIRRKPALGNNSSISRSENANSADTNARHTELAPALPLEDCWSGCVIHRMRTLPASLAKVATLPKFPLHHWAGVSRYGTLFRWASDQPPPRSPTKVAASTSWLCCTASKFCSSVSAMVWAVATVV